MRQSNGERGPAPVLPATGLYSYHNDSPPFSGATNSVSGEPEPLSLASSGVPRYPSNGQGGLTPSPLGGGGGAGSGVAAATTATASGSPTSGSGNPNAQPHHRHYQPVTGRQDVLFDEQEGERQVNGDSWNSGVTDAQHGASTPPPPPHLCICPPKPPSPGNRTASPGMTHSDRPQSSTGNQIHHDDATPSADRANPSTHSSNPNKSASSSDNHATERGPSPGTSQDMFDETSDGEADAEAHQQVYMSNENDQTTDSETAYTFPRHRLKTRMNDESKIPLIIVACGSFSPPTYLHLRMFEMAKDEIEESSTYEIMAGYYSPVSSYYKKSGLAPAHHRVRMCQLAVEHTSRWLMVDPWEAGQPEYQRTAVVLDHFDEMVNGSTSDQGGVEMSDGSRRRYKVMLLAGGDLIESFGEPGVWSEPDLHIILGRFGCLIVERAGSDVWAFLLSHDILYRHRRNVVVVKQLIYNDISSTKVRLFVRRGMSIKYLLPNSVIQYIQQQKLYREPDTKAISG